MLVFGLDFTSTPTVRKPITCATCSLADECLRVLAFDKLVDFTAFERLLQRAGPWIAGLDFPFGQSRTLIAGLGWPTSWSSYVAEVATMSRADFGLILERYRNSQPVGAKQPSRAVDVKAASCSPMMWHGVPVGKMFFEGAPRLLASPANILPCRPTDDSRSIIEAYPALVARRWTGGRGYKNDTKAKQTPEQEAARRAIIAGLRSEGLLAQYGLRMDLGDTLAEDFARDPSGDNLDSLLCAIQAAWAYTRRRSGYGIPRDCDPDEGWIPDPALLAE